MPRAGNRLQFAHPQREHPPAGFAAALPHLHQHQRFSLPRARRARFCLDPLRPSLFQLHLNAALSPLASRRSLSLLRPLPSASALCSPRSLGLHKHQPHSLTLPLPINPAPRLEHCSRLLPLFPRLNTLRLTFILLVSLVTRARAARLSLLVLHCGSREVIGLRRPPKLVSDGLL